MNFISRKLEHPNVVRFFGAYFEIPKVYLVTELLKENLHEYLKKVKPNNVKDLIRYCLNIASGMAYIHSCNVIHRDLKSVNILVRNNLVIITSNNMRHISTKITYVFKGGRKYNLESFGFWSFQICKSATGFL
jgi:serine/threonine protein kinase